MSRLSAETQSTWSKSVRVQSHLYRKHSGTHPPHSQTGDLYVKLRKAQAKTVAPVVVPGRRE